YDVCKTNDFCFAADPDAPNCPHCKEPRLQPNGDPWRTFDYIPITHRLMLQYSDKKRARTLMSYRRRCLADPSASLKDFWDGNLYRDLTADGLFQHDTDVGFFFSIDGVDVFDTRTDFTVSPLVLVNLNLPPEERYLDENVLLLGCIPGPNKPLDKDSFLFPFIREMKRLENGIPHVYNAATERSFTLRAHICVIGTDIPERESLMHSTG
ncbi:hypothetical protein BJ508DRAFT_196111, partial [Ascobolus immersus RN42]